jgi:hypothetical protein
MPGQPIECKTSRKQLASIDDDAIYLYGTVCSTEHAILKQDILRRWGITVQQGAEISIQPVHAM